MTSINLVLDGATAKAQTSGILTAGMVGVAVNIQYSGEWEGLTKSLVCQSDVGCKAVLDVGTDSEVPPEVLRWMKNGRNQLFIGVEGRNEEGSLVIPSVMAYCGEILCGAEPERDEALGKSEKAWEKTLSKVKELEHQWCEQLETVIASIKADGSWVKKFNIPILYLTGDISPIKDSKSNTVTLEYVYGDRTGTCTLKGQGASSYKNAQALIAAGKAGKFNYTIKFDTAFEAADGWGEHTKYCLKANYIDCTHSRNVVSAKLWGLMVKSRSTVPAELSTLPNGGAVDGFPVIVMVNGAFHGLYTWNIPKDEWMFGMAADVSKTQAFVSANNHSDATQFKGELIGDGSDLELEFVSDETNTEWVTTSLNTLINACASSDGTDLDTTLVQYIDWDSAIDYLIFITVVKGTDMVDKNFLLTTFDGTKWFFTAYDIDSVYGLEWDGSALTRAVSNVSFSENAAASKMWELIYRFKTNALKSRYRTLRSNILSETRICQLFENFAWAIPLPVLLEDVKLYPTILGSSVNGIDQICRWVRQRLETVDAWVEALPAQETPVESEVPTSGYTNLVPTSVDTDGSIYNGTGYKDGVRLSSSGSVSSSTQAGSVTTGFMPSAGLKTIRIKGATFASESGKHYYVAAYDANKTLLYALSANENENYGRLSMNARDDGVLEMTLPEPVESTWYKALVESAYIRITAKGSGADLIVTINENIK